MLSARSALGQTHDGATGQQNVIGQGQIQYRCGIRPLDTIGPRMIVAHLPDNTCRIRITIEPMFSRSEFVPMVLESMLDNETRLIMDLGLVSALHSPSLANLVTIHITLAKRGGEMILTGLHERNLKILSITKLDRLFTVA